MPPADPADPPPLTCEASFRQIATDCALAIDAALAVFLDTEDPSGPHKARVALRRLTTAMDAFAPLLRRKRRRALRDQAKHIFRELGQVRDSDVYTRSREDRPGHPKRARANQALREKVRADLRRARMVGFTPALVAAVQPGGDLFRQSADAREARAQPVRAFAADLLGGAWRRCLAYGASVQAIPEADRHEFRKDMKALRYLAEFFADLFPGLEAEPFRSDFRDLQDALGVLNDYAVSLAIEKRKPPARLPAPEAEALTQAQAIWARLASATPPWTI
jgi:CHAD domain-containing protein